SISRMSSNYSWGLRSLRRPTLRRSLRLLSCFDLGRDQSYTVDDLSAVRNINHLSHVLEFNIWIAFDEHHTLGACLEDIRQPLLQIVPAYVVLVDLQLWFFAGGSQHLHHHSTVVRCFVLVGRWRLWYQRLQAFGSQRRDHHENDQQHQKYVDE